MLTAQQKAQAEKKLKNISNQLAYEEQLKSTLKKSTAAIRAFISSLDQDPAKQLQILSKLANEVLPSKISQLDAANESVQEVQDKLKNQKEKLNRESLIFLDEKSKFQAGIDEIKTTILNIQKTVKESVQEEVKKRQKIQEDLEKSLEEIRIKIAEFEKESQEFDKENSELRLKKEELKKKISEIQETYKGKADQRDEEIKQEKDQLNNKLQELQKEVNKATELNKEYSAVQKKNFDNKLSLYLRTKKFPEYSSSFETSAKTLNSCKDELMKGVTRMNQAQQNIEKYEANVGENNNLFLVELKAQHEKEAKLKDIQGQKETVRGRIIELQARLKAKKEASA